MMIFMDGFDYLATGSGGLKWDGNYNTLVTGVYGNGKAINNMSSGITKTLGANFVTAFFGFHFNPGSPIAAGTLCAWLDGGTIQVDLRLDATGALFFTRNGTTIGSVGASGTRLQANTWYWIEAKVTIDASAGVAEVKVNGSSVLAGSSLNSKNTSNAYFNQIRVNTVTSAGAIDSFHFWDTTAGDVTTYMGETVIDTKLPNAVGSNSAWTANGGTHNYDRVDEANQDGDTTYVSSATASQIDSYGFANLTATAGTIRTVAVNTIDRDDDATPRVIEHFVKSSSATALGASISPSSGYKNHQSIFPTDPNTSSAWTVAGRNAAEFGVELIS